MAAPIYFRSVTTYLKGLPSGDIIVGTKQVLIVTKELVIVGFEELGTCRLVSRQQFLANHKNKLNKENWLQ